jgi:hypothetical protein
MLVHCIQEPEAALKRVCAASLADIAKHSTDIATVVVEAGAITHLSALIGAKNSKLKRAGCVGLTQVRIIYLPSTVFYPDIYPYIT